MTRIRLVLATALLSILMLPSAVAQFATGFPPFGSFQNGGADTVNLGNLNVHVSIPVLRKAGRGLDFVDALAYDSSFWSPVCTKNGCSWGYSNIEWFPSGQSASDALGSLAGQEFTNGSCPYNYSYTYTDGAGTTHQFPGIELGPSGGACGPTQATVYALDGSGYAITKGLGGVFLALTLHDISGNVIVASGGSQTITDPTGNPLSLTLTPIPTSQTP